MTTTAVPEPSTIVLLLSLAWLVVSIVLLCKPGLRAAGIVVLVAPLVLVVIAGTFWKFSGSFRPEPPWQPHRVTRTGIDLDAGHGTSRNVIVPPRPSVERDDVVVTSNYAAEAPTAVRAKSFVFLLFAVLVFGGFVSAVVMLAFPKTRLVGFLLLGVGMAVNMVVAGFLLYAEPMRFERSPALVSTQHDDIRTEPSIPVEAGEKVEVKSTKPAAKPPAATVAAKGGAPVKATTADEKKPATTKAADAPATSPAPAKGLPDWVNAPPRMVGDAYQMAIVVGPWKTRQDCDAELPKELQKALDRYAETCLGEQAGARIVLPYDFLRQEVVKGEWEEKIQSPSVGPMTQLHVLLQFDRKVKDRIVEEGRRNVVAGRLWMTGGGLAGLLWLLAVMYGYLTIDLKTGGAYRRRLRFAAVLAILGPVAAALLVAA